MKVPPKVRIFVYGFMLLVILAAVSTSASAQIGIGISVRIGPPALPVYAQPICPGPGYLWTPGYWAWSDDDGYYWVPGTWVVRPSACCGHRATGALPVASTAGIRATGDRMSAFTAGLTTASATAALASSAANGEAAPS